MIGALTMNSIRKMAYEFEKLQGILYVFEVVNGRHILIIASPMNSTFYYCWKGLYLALLHGVVDAKCKFWDYDFKWANCCHD